MTAHIIEIKVLKDSISEADFEALLSEISELLEQRVPSEDYFMQAAFAKEDIKALNNNN